LDIPSLCAEKLKSNKVDIGLAPVAIIPELKKYFIIPDFCIGANGQVMTVMLYSDVSLKGIKNIFLDYQSRTSVMLVQILAKYWWKISPFWTQATKGYEEKIKGTTAGVIIGDRNFSLSRKFKYVYDLSEEWKNFTGLPFVFACWIANKELDENVATDLYRSFRFGLENRDKIAKELKDQFDQEMIRNYLNNCINYSFDKPKHAAMNLFLKLWKKINNLKR
jgi:chorismate dehydratase